MIAETFLSLSTQALQTTFNNIDYNLVKRSAIAISRSDLVHIYGRGESLVLAEDFHYKLIRLGIMSSLESLNGFPEVKHFSADKKIKHTALIVSQFCNSMQVKHVLAELINAKIPYILITASENAWPYDNLALATLRITNIEGRYKMGTFFSRTSIQFLLDCLFGNIFMLDYEKNKENLALFYKRSEERKYFSNPNQL